MTALMISETVKMTPLLGEKVSSCMAAGIAFVEVAGVAVYGVYHVAFAICYDGRILGSNVVQELLQLHHCVDCGLHLLQCKCADGGKDGAVDAA